LNLWVTNKTVSNASITYTLADGTAPAGQVNYDHRKSCWRAQGIDGLLIADESTRRAMYKAVRKFDAA
jgi:hypothetical protein